VQSIAEAFTNLSTPSSPTRASQQSEATLSSDLIDVLDTVDPDGALSLWCSVSSVAQTVALVNWVEALHNQVGLNMGMARAIAFLLADH